MEEPKIKPQFTLEADLGLSAFDVVEIVTKFKGKFGIEISVRDMERLSASDIVDYLSP